MNDSPSAARMVYDSLVDIKRTVESIANNQHEQGLTIERQGSDMRSAARSFEQQTRVNEAVRKDIDDMSDRLDGLARVSWLMTIIGGILVAIAVGVSTDALNKWMDRRTAVTPPIMLLDNQGEGL